MGCARCNSSRGAIHETLGSSRIPLPADLPLRPHSATAPAGADPGRRRLLAGSSLPPDGSVGAMDDPGGGRAVPSLRRPGHPGDLGGGRRALAGLRARPGDDGLDRAAPDRLARDGRRQRLGRGQVRGVGHRGVQGALRHLAGMGAGDHPHRSRLAARAIARGNGGRMEPGHGRARRGGRGDSGGRGQSRSVRGVAAGGAGQVRPDLAAGAELPPAGQPGVVRPTGDDGPHDRGARTRGRRVERTAGEHGHRRTRAAGSSRRRRGRRHHPLAVVGRMGREQDLRHPDGAGACTGPEL